MSRIFGWSVAISALLVSVAFPLIMGTTVIASIAGCASSSGPHGAGNGGASGVDLSSSSSVNSSASSSSSSSSSGEPAPTCNGDVAMTPGYGEAGGYYEDGVLACLRFVPSSYPFKVNSFTAAYSSAPPCSLVPDMLWAIGMPNQTTGFVWSTPVPAQLGGTGTLSVGQTLEAGQALFACLKLASLSASERSCPVGCYFPSTGQNGDYFWGDTAPPDGTMNGGHVIDPPVLEPLSVSPTPTIAASVGNTKIGLVIDVFQAP